MYGVPLTVYRRLATAEERGVAARFGPAWDAYAAATPRFLPRLRQETPGGTAGAGDRTAPTRAHRVRPGSEV